MIEIVNIEKTAYDKFVGQFEGFVKKMTEMGNRGTNKCLGDWLDNDEVCKILKISKRTLQSVIDIVKDRKKDAAWRKPRKKSETKRDCITTED